MQNYSDEELLEVLRTTRGSRKRKAFDCLYLRYAEPMTHYFYFAFHKDLEKARDFLHDLFLKIWEKPERFDTRQQFKPWIFRVASNMCKNEYRKSDVIRKYTSYIQYTKVSHYQLNEPELRLGKCINELDQDKRSLIVLRFKIRLTIKEIAEIYECPEGTVKSRLFYAVKELSKHYKR